MVNWAAANPFKKADTKAQTTQQQPAVKQQQQNKTDNGLNPDPNKKQQQNGQEGNDPLLNFESLWQPDIDAKTGQPVVKQDTKSKSYLPSVDPKKFGEMVEKMDFTRDLDETDLAELREGGDKGIQATMRMLNKASRRAFQSAFAASNKMAEQGFSGARDRFMSEVPDHVRDMMVDSELSSSAEYAKNPALAPIVSTVKKQYLQKFPKATSAEINNAINQYFAYLGGELNKKKADPNQTQDDNASRLRKGAPEADFMEWISKEVGDGAANPFASGEDTEDPNQQQ